ncbi:Asp/Glu racemase [Rhodobacteraceae bacterium CCMM004]|nr:Asp/Glu racemase [Rhodobacteraceae bacterium CCMM004]
MTIHVLNPNSTAAVTEGIDAAIAPMRAVAPVPIRCHTLAEGPPGIESQAHIEGVVQPLLRQAAGLPDASALVVACFSDPGLAALREAQRVPVLGIAESAVLTAMTLGHRFGILSIGRASIPRHLRYLGAMGVTDRLAADLPIGMGVVELADEDRTLTRLTEVGTTLREAHGADVLITGCAGMAQYRARLEAATGLPVVDPCQAAVAMAIGRLALAACDPREDP